MSITITELFPLYSTAREWMEVFKPVKEEENIRLEKEYTVFRQMGRIKKYTVDDKHHRRTGPSTVTYNGVVTVEMYRIHGQCHRVDGPTDIHRNQDGTIDLEIWHLHNKIHREDGPAFTNIAGTFVHQEWYKNGKIHREDGPAIKEWDSETLEVFKSEWWTDGVRVK